MSDEVQSFILSVRATTPQEYPTAKKMDKVELKPNSCDEKNTKFKRNGNSFGQDSDRKLLG
jgi:hypothetical protein